VPTCNRRGLNGEAPYDPSYYGVDDLRDAKGRDRYEVPRHQAKPTRPEDIGEAPMAPHDPMGRNKALGQWYDSREWDR
jgi:hypothetical protein